MKKGLYVIIQMGIFDRTDHINSVGILNQVFYTNSVREACIFGLRFSGVE